LDSLLPRAVATPPPATLPELPTVTLPAPAATPEPGEHVREVPLEQIDRNPYQTRTYIEESALEELATSIRATGVLQPIAVRYIDGRYQLIAGERRWLASQRAGRATIPAIVRQVSNEQAMEMTIIENLQREDLNALEQARAFERLSRDFGLTQEQMAQRTGKDRTSISNFLRLLKLPVEVQMHVEKGALSFGHAKVLMMLDSTERQIEVAERVVREALSVRQTEELIYGMLNPEERPRRERQVDPNVRAAERDLEAALGLRVRIKDRGGKGKITIEYASLEDFDRVVEGLKK
jgi:ParB family chromosome partitioning protein